MSEQVHDSQEIQEFINERRMWLDEAVVAVGGEQGVNPREFFLSPTEVRGDAEPLELSAEQESKLREIAGRFGIGGEADVRPGTAAVFVEGGKPWKIEAEAELASGVRLFGGRQDRRLGDDEKEYLQGKVQPGDPMPETEYDVARWVASREPGFVAQQEDRVIDFGYQMNGVDLRLVAEPTGQIVKIGETYGDPVYMVRIDAGTYTDAKSGSQKNARPQGAGSLKIVAGALDAEGLAVPDIGFLTSNTYAEKALDVTTTGVEDGNTYRVGMYGRQTLAEVKGEPVTSPVPANQIPGVLHVIAGKLDKLQLTVTPQQDEQ